MGKSLIRLVDRETIEGQTFLDIGCGCIGLLGSGCDEYSFARNPSLSKKPQSETAGLCKNEIGIRIRTLS